MSSSVGTARAADDLAGEHVTWGRVGRVAGVVAGVCLATQTVLFLLDDAGLLADQPSYHQTSAGRAHDLAVYYADYFAYQHDVLWDIAVRDVLGPIGYLALMVLAVAMANMLGWRRVVSQLAVLLMVVGATLAAMSDLLYLTTTEYWRHSDWAAAPSQNMVAVGRSVEAIDAATTYPQYAGFVVLALGLGCVGLASRRVAVVRAWTGIFALALATALVAAVVAEVTRLDTAFQVIALLAGVVLAPVTALRLGVDVGRAGIAG